MCVCMYIFINCNIIILDGGGGHTVHNDLSNCTTSTIIFIVIKTNCTIRTKLYIWLILLVPNTQSVVVEKMQNAIQTATYSHIVLLSIVHMLFLYVSMYTYILMESAKLKANNNH